ncbi:hypothetical protein RIF29_41097 [Crotalaria pallida]|uniref:FAR1 domain-containing protein n=1 Tax=Crotalaria pallida TaxID=3830 RepID=A0AAN9E5S2_CROPI
MDEPIVNTGIGNAPPTSSSIDLDNQHVEMVTPTNLHSNDNTEDEITEKDIVPYIGMEFETEDHAYKFYNMYAGFVGFSIRKEWRNTSKLDKEIVISRKYVCFKEGFKKNNDREGKVVRKEKGTFFFCIGHFWEF